MCSRGIKIKVVYLLILYSQKNHSETASLIERTIELCDVYYKKEQLLKIKVTELYIKFQ